MRKQAIQTNALQTALLAVLMGVFSLGTVFGQSLADMARQERAKKAKAGKVITNADVPEATQPAPTPEAGAATEAGKKEEGKTPEGGKTAAAGKEAGKPGESEEEKRAALEKDYRGKFSSLRDSVSTEEKKLDVMQRELNLMQNQYYTDPNVALREQTFRSEINQRTQDLEQQKGVVEKTKQAISDLEEELRKKDLPTDWAR